MRKYTTMKAIAIASFLLVGASYAYAATGKDSGTIQGDKVQVNDEGQRVNIASGIVGEKFKVNDQGQSVNTAGGVKPILTDIVGHWAEASIKDLIGKGIVDGDSHNRFNPDNPLDREELATLVAKMFNLKSESANQDFNDVSASRWSYNYVEATKSFFASTTDPNGGSFFGPLQSVKREEAAAVILKAVFSQNPKVALLDAGSADDLLRTKFTDMNLISASLRPYVATAVQYKIIEGEDTNLFLPQKTLTRAEAATLLDRLFTSGLISGIDNKSVMLEQMKETAAMGQVAGSEFITGKTLIDEVHQKLGKPDAVNSNGEYAESYLPGLGKGSYTFVVGKGEIVSEIRSYGLQSDPMQDITKLTVSDIKKILGDPDKSALFNNQSVLIYNTGDYQLKFYFAGQMNNDSKINHIGVYSPKADIPMGAQ